MDRTFTGGIDEYGFPYLPVIIISKGKEVRAKAIIDTGAAYCIMQKPLIEEFELEPFRPTTLFHPQFGEIKSNDYLVDFVVGIDHPEGGGMIKQVRVGELHDSKYPADLILGVELLKYTQLEYNGLENSFKIRIRI